MENLLLAQLREALPQGMRVPSELEALYAWIEANGFYDDAGGRRRGYLYPQDRLQQSWSDDEREGGMDIVFFTDEPKNRDEELRYWFYGEDRELAAEIKQRLGGLDVRTVAGRCGRDEDRAHGLRLGLDDDLRFGSQRA